MEDEIHPRHRRLQILLEPREQEGEDDTGDRDVERDAAAQRVEQPRALLGWTSAVSASIAAARMLLWIVKKLKKLPAPKVGRSVLAANW